VWNLTGDVTCGDAFGFSAIRKPRREPGLRMAMGVGAGLFYWDLRFIKGYRNAGPSASLRMTGIYKKPGICKKLDICKGL